MTQKEQALHAIQDLPEDASYEDAGARLVLLAKLERGKAQADAGQTLSHAAVKERMEKWLK